MSQSNKPVVIAIDIQREYTTPGRPYCMAGIQPSLDNCRRIIRQARSAGWPVIHVRHLQDGSVFNPQDLHSQFVEGCEPAQGEAVVTKSKLSSYSNDEFRRILDGHDSAEFLVIGYGSNMCCLATIVSGAVFGHRFSFIHDASWARAVGGSTEQEAHASASRILGIHARLRTTDELLEALQDAA